MGGLENGSEYINHLVARLLRKLLINQTKSRTPYERFTSLPDAEQYLKPGITLAELDVIARRMSDTDYAMLMQKQKVELSKKLSR